MIIETYVRIFVDETALDSSIAFYTGLLGGELTQRFAYPERELELAVVSSPRLSILLIAGTPEHRAPFEATRLTIKVDSLDRFVPDLIASGAQQLEPVQTTPVGWKTRFGHPDGLIVEYVEQRQPS